MGGQRDRGAPLAAGAREGGALGWCWSAGPAGTMQAMQAAGGPQFK